MTLAVWFWILMVIWLVFGLYAGYAPNQPYTYRHWGPNLLLFILLIVLGWATFGTPVTR